MTKAREPAVLYINGVNVANRTDAPITVLNSVADIAVGAWLDSPNNARSFFHGMIDELSFYNRALQDEEVAEIYHTGSSGKFKPTTVTDITRTTDRSVNTAGTITPNIVTCQPPPSGLVSWWSAEGNAGDSLGTNNGVLKNGVTFAAGEVGQAFNFDGASQYVQLPNSPSLNPAGSFSIEAWIYVTNGGAVNTIMDKWATSGPWGNQRSYAFHVNPNGVLVFSISDATNQLDTAFQDFLTTNNAVPFNTWTHVAAVYDQSTGTRRMYVNAVNLTNRTDPPITVLNSIADAGIGAGLDSPGGPFSFFAGRIDELSFYNRALSGTDVSNIFNAGSSGKCPLPPVIISQPTNQTVVLGSTATFSVSVAGLPPLGYQWLVNGTSISSATNLSATNATLTLTNVQAGQSSNNYSVLVSNSAGFTNSSNALLTLLFPPTITLNPSNQLLELSCPVTLTAAAAGSGTLTYQWRKNSTNLTGQTGTNLNIPSVQTTDLGNYTLVASNLYGQATSTVAMGQTRQPPCSGIDDRPALSERRPAYQYCILARRRHRFRWRRPDRAGCESKQFCRWNRQPERAPYQLPAPSRLHERGRFLLHFERRALRRDSGRNGAGAGTRRY